MLKRCIPLVFFICFTVFLNGCMNASNHVTSSFERFEHKQLDNSQMEAIQKTETYPTDNISTIISITERVHESLPEFTFIRAIGDYLPETEYDIPNPVEVSIIVKDNEDGNLIQEILNLTQSQYFIIFDLRLEDFNFDGYLDMRLLRWQNDAGGLLANEYFWLWDTEISQFVLNEQLVEIGNASELRVDSDIKQLVVFNRGYASIMDHHIDWYEYQEDAFVRVLEEQFVLVYDDDDSVTHTEIIRTDFKTGEITYEVEPYP